MKNTEANDAKQEITKTARGDSSRLSCEVRTLDGLCLCDKKKNSLLSFVLDEPEADRSAESETNLYENNTNLNFSN